jgi:hypothetical protein
MWFLGLTFCYTLRLLTVLKGAKQDKSSCKYGFVLRYFLSTEYSRKYPSLRVYASAKH